MQIAVLYIKYIFLLIFIYIIVNLLNTTQRHQHPFMNVLYVDILCFLYYELYIFFMLDL
jgi:hypothetical protein